MRTECSGARYVFPWVDRRRVEARFDGGRLSSDGGAVLLREVEAQRGVIRQFASCFTDHRNPTRIEHSVAALIAQRVYGLALGYEDLNDHEELRSDPLLALLVGERDLLGAQRARRRDRGQALAGKSTLNRLELGAGEAGGEHRYRKITVDPAAVNRFLVDVYVQAHAAPPASIVLDLDATDDPLHGRQEDRFFHGYYGHYCYLPLYIFAGDFPLCAQLRPANIDAAAGSVEAVERIVKQLRAAWPQVAILVRGDGGFCREALMASCEAHDVDFLFGLARNARLERWLAPFLTAAEAAFTTTGEPARVFAETDYQTLESWSRPRRVVGKAEWLAKGANPRFVVTSLSCAKVDAQTLYEQHYCARGEMENRIKEQQLDLFADRTSASSFATNQLRLWCSTVAYLLVAELRRLGLKGTAWARAQCGTIRLRLLRIGARIQVSVRRIRIALASGYPYEALFAQVYANLRRAPPPAPGTV
jgi:hypothetical protein